MTNINKLKHLCQWYYVPGSEICYKPFPNASYMKREFKIQCIRCQDNRTVQCTTQADMESKIAKYPVLPKFPK